jgi:hypothetical protein
MDVRQTDAASHAAVADMPLAWLASVGSNRDRLDDCCKLGAVTLGRLFARRAAVIAYQQLPAFQHSAHLPALEQAADRLIARLPPAWAAAGAGCQPQPPGTQQLPWLQAVQVAMAWTDPDSGALLRPWQLTVKVATRLQLVAKQRARITKLAAAAALVGRTGNDATAALSRAWRLPWDNKHKQVLWTLLRNAIPTAERLQQRWLCGCGTAAPGRLHHFWQCPVAQAVVRELRRHLPVFARALLEPAHVWLGEAPPGLHPGSWSVVALAALNAMAHARRRMTAQVLGDDHTPPTPAPLPTALLERLSRRAVAKFWELISDFCALQLAPVEWRDAHGHYFFTYTAHGHWEARRLQFV